MKIKTMQTLSRLIYIHVIAITALYFLQHSILYILYFLRYFIFIIKSRSEVTWCWFRINGNAKQFVFLLLNVIYVCMY